MFHGGWISLFKYLIFRIKHNIRVIPVREDAAKHSGRNPETDPDRKYVNNDPVE
jgi:hypothetical protein